MERDEYNERAINAETELPSVPQKKELRRVLANLSNLVCNLHHASYKGYSVYYEI